ncbi:MAG TPA: hypothetical protein VKV32_00940 [Stellaceae bacterium]|nr:hypothetical protein [Stellaceae bacterium]
MPTAIPRPRGYIDPPPRSRLSEFAGTSFDAEDITRAERAVAKVLEKYPTLLGDEVARLVAAWAAAPEKLDSESVAPVFAAAHDLAGYGETFGYPLVTILSRSLCRLLTMGDLNRSHMTTVVEAHINALNAVVKNRMQGDGGETGLSLGVSLDKAIIKFQLSFGAEQPSRLHAEIAALQTKK